MRLDNKTKGLIILLTPFILGFLLGLAVGGCNKGTCRQGNSQTESITQASADIKSSEENAVPSKPAKPSKPEESSKPTEPSKKEEVTKQQKEIIYPPKRKNYGKLFNDINEEHLAMAKKVGLQNPPQMSAEIPGIKGLVKLESNDLYTIYSLSHSSPYLTKGAANELDAIARAFKDSLSRKGLLEYRIVVSSILRSKDDVKKLRRSGNPNASENSAHCYGATFDIAYTMYTRDNDEKCDEFMQPFELTKVLGEVLLDRKKAGKCLVKFERKEHCFHITSTH